MISDKPRIQPGDIYEDCAYHPYVCFGIGEEDGDIMVWGISLIDGSQPRSCRLNHCGVHKMTLEEAWQRKLEFAEGRFKKPDKKQGYSLPRPFCHPRESGDPAFQVDLATFAIPHHFRYTPSIRGAARLFLLGRNWT
jgi:hypothetical protein